MPRRWHVNMCVGGMLMSLILSYILVIGVGYFTGVWTHKKGYSVFENERHSILLYLICAAIGSILGVSLS